MSPPVRLSLELGEVRSTMLFLGLAAWGFEAGKPRFQFNVALISARLKVRDGAGGVVGLNSATKNSAWVGVELSLEPAALVLVAASPISLLLSTVAG